MFNYKEVIELIKRLNCEIDKESNRTKKEQLSLLINQKENELYEYLIPE